MSPLVPRVSRSRDGWLDATPLAAAALLLTASDPAALAPLVSAL